MAPVAATTRRFRRSRVSPDFGETFELAFTIASRLYGVARILDRLPQLLQASQTRSILHRRLFHAEVDAGTGDLREHQLSARSTWYTQAAHVIPSDVQGSRDCSPFLQVRCHGYSASGRRSGRDAD